MESTINTPQTRPTDIFPQPGRYPSVRRRFMSLFIDYLFIVFCMIILVQLFLHTDEEKTGSLRGIAMISLFFVYEPFCMVLGCSLGNYIAGIRVRKFGNEDKRINIFQSYGRFIVKLLHGIISFFTVTVDPWKRAIHDQVAGSVMIYAKWQPEFQTNL